MNKYEPHLARLAAYAEIMMNGEMAEQFGAICSRLGAGGTIEVLLITTRETHRWTIPKGWPIKGLKPNEVAEREAWEEAGVKGKAEKKPFGYYTYLKIFDSENATPSMVEVHLLRVQKLCAKFPERKERTTEWFSPLEAAKRVQEPELKGLLVRLMHFPIENVVAEMDRRKSRS
ncbi:MULTISPECIES: NUDIX hydrolase [unclassified Rhizobium]|uniref:NUDIX hydrolase n=1 Tax=unclassified Rhizobium TaxID=2613769 RepID=UPI000CDF3182|nr:MULTISPECIES: NUDIX hydrolase [Rhizobium]AVA23682.1 NUDIX hydrolase domain-containing protein [Rhizobium sp. NXC24]UWU25959.1 NUDIX hydrolase [Rhizobium tropici]